MNNGIVISVIQIKIGLQIHYGLRSLQPRQGWRDSSPKSSFSTINQDKIAKVKETSKFLGKGHVGFAPIYRDLTG